MNELELRNLWKSVQDNQENILYINNQNRKEVARLKMIYLVRNLAPIKKFAILVGTAWVLCGSMVISNLFLHAYPLVNKFFLFSATAQVTVTAIALIIYIYQLIKIYQVDLSETVLQTQIKLANLKNFNSLVIQDIVFTVTVLDHLLVEFKYIYFLELVARSYCLIYYAYFYRCIYLVIFEP